MRDARYAQWLEIAKALEALHEFVYGENGPFSHIKEAPFRPTGNEASAWIRNKCSNGRWYWWDKTTLAGKAEEPLRTIYRVIGDSGGRYEEIKSGQEMIEKMSRLRDLIAAT